MIEKLESLNPDAHPTIGAIHGDAYILDRNKVAHDLETLAGEYQAKIEAICVDKNQHLTYSEVTDFRIGEWSNEIYSITLRNGHKFEATGQQKVMLNNSEWISIEELTFGTPLFSLKYGPNINPERIDNIVEHVHKKHLEHKLPLYSFTVKNGNNLLITNPNMTNQSFITVHTSVSQ